MDTTAKRREILARLKSGEITEEEADTALERLMNPPKRGRGRPETPKMFLRGANGERVELRGRKRRKASRRELEIGGDYVRQVEAGIKPMLAMRNTLKKFSTKRNPLEGSSVRRYAGYYKQYRKEQAEHFKRWHEFRRAFDPRRQLEESLAMMNQAGIAKLTCEEMSAFQSSARESITLMGVESVRRQMEAFDPRRQIQETLEKMNQSSMSAAMAGMKQAGIDAAMSQFESMSERIRRESVAALSRAVRGFEVGQKK